MKKKKNELIPIIKGKDLYFIWYFEKEF